MNTKQRNANLGAKGWGLIGFGALIYLVGGAFWNNSISNVVLPIFAQNTGSTPADLLYVATILGYIMIPLNFAIGFLYSKFGTRKTLGVSLAVVAVSLVLYGHTTSILQYAVVRFLISFASQSYTQVGLSAMYARYFPTKKGFVLGWATVGASATNIVSLPVFNALFARFGLNVTFYIFAAYVVVMALVNFILIPDDPAKMGYQPDNGDSDPKVLEALKVAATSSVKVWTRREAIRTKNFWLMVIGHSILFMSTTAFMMQIVPHMVRNGIPQTTGVKYVAIMGAVGMVSSAVSGWVDQKIGARKTTVIMGLSYAAAFFCVGALPFNNVTLFLGLFFYCAVMGAVSNLPSSHMISVFGSSSFTSIFGIFFPIMAIVASSAPAVLAFSMNKTGANNLAYIIFCVLCIVGVILIALSADGMDKLPGEKPVAYKLKRGEKKNHRVA